MVCGKKNILVTGGTGLVGHGIQLALENSELKNENWTFMSSKDCDLLDAEATMEYFNRMKPNYVIHLAARAGGLYAIQRDNLGFFTDNVRMAENVLEAAYQCKVEKVISCLSTCVFPHAAEFPVDESVIHNGPPHASIYGYAHAKRMVDILSRAYCDKYGVKFTSVIPTNLFGPYDNFNLASANVLPALIHKTYVAKQNNDPVVVWGTGSALRQFTYSVDLGRLFLWALQHYEDAEPIILSVPEEDEVTIKQAAETIASSMGLKDLQFDTTKGDGQLKKTASAGKLRKLYPEFTFTPFNEAIQQTCEWFAENFESARK